MTGSSVISTDLADFQRVPGLHSTDDSQKVSCMSGEVKRTTDYCNGALRGVAPIISILKNLLCKKFSEKK